MRKEKRPPYWIITLLVIVSISFAYVRGIPFLDLVELKAIDLRFSSRGEIAPESPVVLATIDEKSVDREGKWVWPRSKMAMLVEKLSEAGCRVIAFDIGFIEPDEQAVPRALDQIQAEMEHLGIRSGALTLLLQQVRAENDHDATFAESIRNSRAKVVLGQFFLQEDYAASIDASEAEILDHIENIRGSRYKLIQWQSDAAQEVAFDEAALPQSNISIISAATPFSGYFNMFPDREDGVVRWIPGVLKFRDTFYAPLSLVAIGAYLDRPLAMDVRDYGVKSLKVGRYSIPTDEKGRILINYRGPVHTFPHIPVTDILRGEADPADLKDKIVLVGATAQGIYDMRVTPVGTVFPGLEIHANLVDSVLTQDFLFYPTWARIFGILAILLAGLVLGAFLPRAGALTGGGASLGLAAGHFFLTQFLFTHQGWILNLVYPLSTILILYIGITALKFLVETRQKKFIKSAFATYVAPSVVKQLIESPEKLVLGGEEREITAFFSDVQGFTGISERLSPTELVELLNVFLTEMTDIILSREGTVDKFEGDAIIAFFGAPNPMQNHALVACQACIEMQKRLAELRRRWREEKKPELVMRIGMHTGPAVVGNMGSRSRMDYTMMGNTVNTAARLEGVNKVYGTYTLVGDTTCRAAGSGILFRELDSVKVVGKLEPVGIHQLLGYPGDLEDNFKRAVDLYAKGLAAYRRQHWDDAIKAFEKALEQAPEDAPSQRMLMRCRQYQSAPPPRDWDGSCSMDRK